MNACKGGALAALAILLALPAAALAAPSRAELEERVLRLERLADNQGLVELARQVQALEAELRSLRGGLEELQHAMDSAREQQRAQYLDLDSRLQAAEERVASLAVPAPAATDPAAGYQAAFDLLKQGDYAAARQGFEAFLADHPGHELASNARYWLGEVAYVERDFEGALRSFERVLADYPAARKAPDALLKSGFCHYELQRYGAARAALSRVVAEYPDAPAAQEAAARLARMDAAGR